MGRTLWFQVVAFHGKSSRRSGSLWMKVVLVVLLCDWVLLLPELTSSPPKGGRAEGLGDACRAQALTGLGRPEKGSERGAAAEGSRKALCANSAVRRDRSFHSEDF